MSAILIYQPSEVVLSLMTNVLESDGFQVLNTQALDLKKELHGLVQNLSAAIINIEQINTDDYMPYQIFNLLHQFCALPILLHAKSYNLAQQWYQRANNIYWLPLCCNGNTLLSRLHGIIQQPCQPQPIDYSSTETSPLRIA